MVHGFHMTCRSLTGGAQAARQLHQIPEDPGCRHRRARTRAPACHHLTALSHSRLCRRAALHPLPRSWVLGGDHEQPDLLHQS